MQSQCSNLCSHCGQLFADSSFWDPPAQSNDSPSAYKSGAVMNRVFSEIQGSDCSMCQLICAALQREGCRRLPAPNRHIYFSRILYGKYTFQTSPVSTKIETPSISVKRTYRLRVSTVFQYGTLPDLEDERFFQRRTHISWDRTSYEGDIMLVKEEGDDDVLFHGRTLPQNLNIPLVKRWVGTCSERCASACNLERPDVDARPARVIDTKRLMVQEMPSTREYAALSYTWGRSDVTQFELTKENEPQLTKPGGLTEVYTEIPRTVRDAITLCRDLGIRYLWVDALCWGTGPGYSAEKQPGGIRKIFEAAYLTIVGNGPNSHYGLQGVRPHSSRPRRQILQTVGNLSLAVCKPSIDYSMMNTGWMKRKWTYDEWNVSRRLLILSDHQAFFCCETENKVYSEDTYSEPDQEAVISSDLPELDDFWSFYEGWDGGFDVYAAKAMEYSHRYVTKEDDLSAGFSGVKSKLQNTLGSTYHYDLPLRFFAQALCFSILSGRRRQSLKFPSWSWQGWIVSCPSGLDYHSRWGFEPIGHPVTYFCTSSVQGPGGFQFQMIYDGPDTATGVSSKSLAAEHPCPAVIDGLPDTLKPHLIAFKAPVFDLFMFRSGEEWNVAVQDGGEADQNVGTAILNLANEQTISGYFKVVFIGFSCSEREGESNEFLLVVEPSDYKHILRRVGSCVHLEPDKLEGRFKWEMVYLI
ncbi:hypothetical protein ASPVEDRAFT_374523 [Aspergillus versicolor CBS 583.65]|uniref:Heterokaryon incompatibility domain-containing protein n=1 Tax=Aspergillus versicolor CBS 583.65 TaxID=1036611 RepID=A0A1L9Q1V9_ASPVE|nr:uncharacterized protein ASPVEDRAFT_374523 [Aspergillus versicolor CBS 583.65]OJJ07775.1 hypothetical protein ASPVEDRAFT_374523 [Aspergillus versicolor CBS 583.65]